MFFLFLGEFAADKIYFAQDGDVKLFDPYLDTLCQVAIPFIFEKEIEITGKAGTNLKISPLPDWKDRKSVV